MEADVVLCMAAALLFIVAILYQRITSRRAALEAPAQAAKEVPSPRIKMGAKERIFALFLVVGWLAAVAWAYHGIKHGGDYGNIAAAIAMLVLTFCGLFVFVFGGSILSLLRSGITKGTSAMVFLGMICLVFSAIAAVANEVKYITLSIDLALFLLATGTVIYLARKHRPKAEVPPAVEDV